MRGRRPVMLAGTMACTLTWAAACWAAAGAAAGQPVTGAQAKTHLLALSDLPKGWSTERGTADTQNAAYPAGSPFIACLGAGAGLPEAVPPEVDSPYFQNKDGSQEMQDAISTFKTSAAAHSSFAALASPAFAACASNALNAYLKSNPAQGATIGTLTVGPPLGTKFGAHTNGYRADRPDHLTGTDGRHDDHHRLLHPGHARAAAHVHRVRLGKLGHCLPTCGNPAHDHRGREEALTP